MKLVSALHKTNYSIQEARLEALTKLEESFETSPVDMSRRFPENTKWICTSNTDWAAKFTQLRMALMFKASKEKTDKSNEFSDSFNSFFKGLLQIQTSARSGNGVYDRVTFENRYHLVWT